MFHGLDMLKVMDIGLGGKPFDSLRALETTVRAALHFPKLEKRKEIPQHKVPYFMERHF